jgi:hypothetical protein
VSREVGGEDALQAVILAFYMIGSDLYLSSFHKEGILTLDGKNGSYGFPLFSSLQDGVEGYAEL